MCLYLCVGVFVFVLIWVYVEKVEEMNVELHAESQQALVPDLHTDHQCYAMLHTDATQLRRCCAFADGRYLLQTHTHIQTLSHTRKHLLTLL